MELAEGLDMLKPGHCKDSYVSGCLPQSQEDPCRHSFDCRFPIVLCSSAASFIFLAIVRFYDRELSSNSLTFVLWNVSLWYRENKQLVFSRKFHIYKSVYRAMWIRSHSHCQYRCFTVCKQKGMIHSVPSL